MDSIVQNLTINSFLQLSELKNINLTKNWRKVENLAFSQFLVKKFFSHISAYKSPIKMQRCKFDSAAKSADSLSMNLKNNICVKNFGRNEFEILEK